MDTEEYRKYRDEYAEFLIQNEGNFHAYANLDVIGNGELTYTLFAHTPYEVPGIVVDVHRIHRCHWRHNLSGCHATPTGPPHGSQTAQGDQAGWRSTFAYYEAALPLCENLILDQPIQPQISAYRSASLHRDVSCLDPC